jgi:hypothetical protein
LRATSRAAAEVDRTTNQRHALVISFVLFGYSIDHYENGDCQSGAPCPTGEHVIEYLEPGTFIAGATLVLVGFVRNLWNYWELDAGVASAPGLEPVAARSTLKA